MFRKPRADRLHYSCRFRPTYHYQSHSPEAALLQQVFDLFKIFKNVTKVHRDNSGKI